MSDTQTAAPPVPPTAKLARVRESSVGLVFMLIIQFILGIVYNLYGKAPAPGQPIGLFSNVWLILHEIMAVLLIGAAIGVVARAMSTSSGQVKGRSWVGLIAILGAIGVGVSFTRNGSTGASLGMSLAFAVALICYVVNVVRLPSSES